MAEMPSGTVTFLFSDVEGSTQLLERHGAAMGGGLARHHELFELIVENHGGAIFETVGDAVYAAFSDAGAAVAAALDAQLALAAEDWGPIGRMAVRIALHTGTVERRGDHYFGPALFRVARLQALGYGEQTLLSGVTAGLAADALPADASLRDLGSHRLKDLGEPEHVYQLVHPRQRLEFPALKSLDAHPHNLPLQLSTFVGRDAELAEVGEVLREHRLVTLLGPGGIGKTRLALQVSADALEEFPDGVFFVDLAPVRDPELMPGTVAASLGLREQPGQPINATVAEHLAPRHLLLVLDNLEQLLPAAAATVTELLAAAPSTRVLATSRAPVRIRGEQEYTVPSLAAGAPAILDVAPPPAVALFVERAREIHPTLAIDANTGPVIADICMRLDGLPLAIELAAARLRVLGLPALRDRLRERLPMLTGGARDLPERHRTLRGAIAWSEELLTTEQRGLFADLGVFVGGFTLEAVEAVTDGRLGGATVDTLGELVEHSLVRVLPAGTDADRYGLLETVREYAAERLAESPDAELVRERHALWLLQYAREAEGHFRGPDGTTWLDRVEQEHDNIRAGLTWLSDTGREESLGQLVAAVVTFWRLHGHFAESLRWIALILAAPSTGSKVRAAALRAAAALHFEAGASRRAQDEIDESVRLYESIGEDKGLADALQAQGNLYMASGRLLEAKQVLGRAAELAGHANLPTRIGALGNLALIAHREERVDESRDLLEQLQREAEAAGDLFSVGMSTGNLMALYKDEGRTDEAVAAGRQSVDAFRRLGDRSDLSWALANFSGVLMTVGDLAGAEETLREGIILAVETGAVWILAGLFLNRAGLEEARGEFVEAVRWTALSKKVRDEAGEVLPPNEERDFDAAVAHLQEVLSADEFATAWAKGESEEPLAAARSLALG
jgi:predicted ATPase/class 3 adenylate cyclase